MVTVLKFFRNDDISKLLCFICSRSFGLQNGWQFQAPWLMVDGVARIFKHRWVWCVLCVFALQCRRCRLIVPFNEDISWWTQFRYTQIQTTHMQDESNEYTVTQFLCLLMNIERYENHVTIRRPPFYHNIINFQDNFGLAVYPLGIFALPVPPSHSHPHWNPILNSISIKKRT